MTRFVPWIASEQRSLMLRRGRLIACEIHPETEGVLVPDEACVTCTIVQWCGTPQCIDPLYTMTAKLREAWKAIAQEYNETTTDFSLRALDCMLILAMFIAGEIAHVPQAVLQKDCADIAEYFCRYVRLIQVQAEWERSHTTQQTIF